MKSLIKSLEFIIMYTVRNHWPYGYEIIFDNDTVLMWISNKPDADRICGALNGAYNIGRSSAKLG